MLAIDDLDDRRPGTADDLAAIRNDDWNDAVDVEELSAHDGDLSLDDDLSVHGGALLVRGDLTVAGTVTVDETGTLVVTGSHGGASVVPYALAVRAWRPPSCQRRSMACRQEGGTGLTRLPSTSMR